MKSSYCLVAFAGIAATAKAATQFPPLQRVAVLEAAVPLSNPPLHLVRGAKISFAPGQPTGLHNHPVSTVGIVTEGEILFQPDGERARTLHIGDPFFEPANHRILRFDNPSPTRPAAITVFYLTDSMKRPLIDMLKK